MSSLHRECSIDIRGFTGLETDHVLSLATNNRGAFTAVEIALLSKLLF